MPRGKKRPVEEVIRLLRDMQIELGIGRSVKEVCRAHGISEHSYYKWRNRYAGMTTNEAVDAAQLRRENAQLKKLVAEQALDLSIVREALKGKW